MTRERMEDVRAALEAHGWRLLEEPDDPRAGGEPFELVHEAVTWVIARGDGRAVVLEFQAFADLGGRTDRLADVAHCDVVGADVRLYFSKRLQPAWRADLTTFVHRLGEIARATSRDASG